MADGALALSDIPQVFRIDDLPPRMAAEDGTTSGRWITALIKSGAERRAAEAGKSHV